MKIFIREKLKRSIYFLPKYLLVVKKSKYLFTNTKRVENK